MNQTKAFLIEVSKKEDWNMDSNGNDSSMYNGSTTQIHRAGIHPKETTTETVNKRPNLLVEVKANTHRLKAIKKIPKI